MTTKTTKARRIYDKTMGTIRAMGLDYMRQIDSLTNVNRDGERDGWIYARTLKEMRAQLERDKRHTITLFKIYGGMTDEVAAEVNALRIMENTLKNAEEIYRS